MFTIILRERIKSTDLLAVQRLLEGYEVIRSESSTVSSQYFSGSKKGKVEIYHY
ncbi:hypothetical protein [Acidianus sulfidivorans]|uniref:hypothetical protein n=1 Tax=Acidianus sulfidivorans TaxID=312539 RepID=UPI0013A535FA|nr:hypothetical protein [Acidianus sulfidivorans]